MQVYMHLATTTIGDIQCMSATVNIYLLFIVEISVKRTLFNRSHTVSEFGRDKIEKARTSKKCKKGWLINNNNTS